MVLRIRLIPYSDSYPTQEAGLVRVRLILPYLLSWDPRALVNLKNRGVKVRQITEITKENARYCKELVKNIDELRHLDGVKANFAVSETEYVATSTLREARSGTRGYL